jgi:hypothetical protein
LLLLLFKSLLNMQVPRFKIGSKVVLAFIVLVTRDLIKELLSRRFTLFIKCITL